MVILHKEPGKKKTHWKEWKDMVLRSTNNYYKKEKEKKKK